jgi:hypothetical protein
MSYFSMLDKLKISLGDNDEVVCDADDIFDLDNNPLGMDNMSTPWEPHDLPQFSCNVSN